MIRNVLYRLVLTILTVGGITLILISPLGLQRFATVKRVNWAQLSNIGQTYGAVSALLAGIALAGVAISLLLQSRGLALSRAQVMRTFHLDLIRFSIENPRLIQSWGYAPSSGATLEDIQRAGFVNMLVSFWVTSYRIGTISADELRADFQVLFNGDAGRQWWIESQDVWFKGQDDRRSRHVMNIIREEFDAAEDKGPPLVTAALWAKREQEDMMQNKLCRIEQKFYIPVAFGAGVVFASKVLRKRRASLLCVWLEVG